MEEKQPIDAIKWVNPNCYYFKHLIFSGSQITNIRNGYVNVFGSGVLNMSNRQSSFTININNINNYIALGIVDTQYSNKDNISRCPNFIFYRNNGDCFVGDEYVGNFGAGY